jgi:hypothetical protein
VSGPLIVLTGLVYAYVAGEQAVKGNVAMGVVYAGYAFANVGMWMALK